MAQRNQFAVCPAIELDGAHREARLFRSEKAAWGFLNSETHFRGEPRRELMSLNKKILTPPKKQGQLRADVAKKPTPQNAASSSSVQSAPKKILNKSQGWQNPVPVKHAIDYSGPKCERRVRDVLRLDATIAPASSFDEEFRRLFDGRSGDYTCYLGEDWRFGKIEKDAWMGIGHEYAGQNIRSIGEILAGAIHDLETAFLRAHPNASSNAVADFWQSWQVQRHIADFCCPLANSDTARMLAGTVETRDQVERFRIIANRQLAAFAHDVFAPASLRTNLPGKTLDEKGSIDHKQTDPKLGSSEDDQQTARAKIRSEWLDKQMNEHHLTSDLEIEGKRGPAYNTIRRYRGGKITTRDRYVRDKLATVFGCLIDEVPK